MQCNHQLTPLADHTLREPYLEGSDLARQKGENVLSAIREEDYLRDS